MPAFEGGARPLPETPASTTTPAHPMQFSTDATHSLGAPYVDGAADPVALLSDVRRRLSRVVHDVNNPLAIISGNAQLLVELARMMDLDPELAKPISDIEEASRQLAERVELLAQLKEEVLTALGEQEDHF